MTSAPVVVRFGRPNNSPTTLSSAGYRSTESVSSFGCRMEPYRHGSSRIPAWVLSPANSSHAPVHFMSCNSLLPWAKMAVLVDRRPFAGISSRCPRSITTPEGPSRAKSVSWQAQGGRVKYRMVERMRSWLFEHEERRESRGGMQEVHNRHRRSPDTHHQPVPEWVPSSQRIRKISGYRRGSALSSSRQ